MKGLRFAAALSLVLAACGGDPFAWLPPPGELRGYLEIGRDDESHCAWLLVDNGRYALILPDGWSVEDGALHPPSPALPAPADGARLWVHGMGIEASPDACRGDPYVVDRIDIVADDG